LVALLFESVASIKSNEELLEDFKGELSKKKDYDGHVLYFLKILPNC
jgi:hypothetical protein